MSDALREAEMLAFEAWMRSDGTLPLDRDSFDYADFHVALMWHAWEAARSALTAPPAPAVPAGWQLVPVKPTDEMCAAGRDWAILPHRCYRAMLAAAAQAAPQPTPQATPQSEHPIVVAWLAGQVVQYLVRDDYDGEWTDYTGRTHPDTFTGRLSWRLKPAPQPTQED